MAEDVVLARFTADLAQLQKDFDKYISQLQKVEDKQEDVADSTKDLATTAADASKKRTDALKKEEAELKRLQIEQKRAFDPKVIKTYNDRISESQKRISLLKGETSQFGSVAKSALAGVGAGLLAAFSVGAVSAFAKSSIDAFIEAEENANRLKFAITQVAGESEAVFDKLIKQSEELADISIFTDDDIQKAQTALATFGLTANQIDKLIPKILDLASANKIDLASATEAAIRSFEGSTKGLVTLGIKFDDTGSRIGNYNKFIESTEKLTGATAAATETLAGQLQQTSNRANELQEDIGSNLAPAFTRFKVAVFEATLSLLNYGRTTEQVLKKNERVGKTAGDAVIKNLEKQGLTTEELIGRLERFAQATQEETDKLELNRQLRVRKQQLSIAESNEIKNQIELNKGLIQTIDDYIESLKVTATEEARILTARELQSKSVEDLNKLLKENSELTDAISKDNVEAINKELDARLKANKKAAEEAEKALNALKAKFGKFEFILPIELKNDIDIPELLPKPIEIPVVINEGNLVDSFFKANEQIIGLSQQLVGELSQLYGTLVERQIEGIEKTKQAQLDAISVQIEANSEALDKRRISTREAELMEKRLLDEQVKAEKEADKKIREIKRKQAIADKAAALIQITIDTARAVAESLPAVPVAALMAVLGAAQAAIVLAQPIPYEKGTTSSHEGWAQVDESGKEMIIRPKDNRGRLTYMEKGTKVVPAKETKQYSALFDSIIEGKGEEFLFKNYLTPALAKQKEDFQKQEQQSFANNITKSIIYQQQMGGKGDYFLEKIAKRIGTAEEIGAAVARNLPVQDIYRR